MAIELKLPDVGTKLTFLNRITGVEDGWTIMSSEGGLIKAVSDKGSEVTRLESWVGPSIQWDNGYDKGAAVIDWQIGSLWPLEVGQRAYYHRVITLADGTTRDENWRCSVNGLRKVHLATTSKVFDAFEIVCLTEANVHIWYWDAADTAGPLKYVRKSPITAVVDAYLEVFDRMGLDY